MTMSYTEWLQAVVTIANIADAAGVAAFSAVAPRCIEYVEGRIFNDDDLDFLFTRHSDVSQITVRGRRSVPIPSQFIIVEGVSLILPTDTQPTAGQRVPLLRTTRQFIDATWPTESQTQAPAPFQTYYALFNENDPASADSTLTPGPSAFLIAPTPDGAYVAEVTGTIQPDPLSATNSPTFLTTYYPELYLAGSLVWIFGYQRDFGAQTSDPQAAMSWERVYQELKDVAAAQTARQKSQGASWTSFGHPAIANLMRTGAISPGMMMPPSGPMPAG